MSTALDDVAVASLVAAGLCALVIVIDEWRRPQRMWIMNVVWPVTALYLGPLALLAYAQLARREKKTFWEQVLVAVTHCGGGCTLGDIVAESSIFALGIRLFASAFAAYLVGDYIFAYLLGIVFQYFTIAPMKGLHGWAGIWAAVKADTLSLTAFEVGLFGWMALVHFVLLHPEPKPNSAVYWFSMQIGMCIGFMTAYPMNWWLLRAGLKEAM